MKKFLLTVLLAASFGIVSNAQTAVIANKSISENSINKSKLSDIYMSKTKTWGDGTKIIRFTHKTENLNEKIFEAVGKPIAEMKKLWMKIQLTGGGQAPEALGADEEMINKVSSTPGAIGYIDSKKVNDKVKVLLIID